MPDIEKAGQVPTPERQPEKAVKMPAREELTKKLKEGDFLGSSSIEDSFYNRLIDGLADRSINGPGINIEWELAMHDTLRDYPDAVRTVVNTDFEHIIDRVTPDPDVAGRAKEVRRQVLEQMRKEQQRNQ